MSKELYEQDENLWREKQMELIQEGKIENLDYDCIHKMLLEMGISDKRSVDGLTRNVLLHLLKLKYQPSRMTRSWFSSVTNGRSDLISILSIAPSLKNHFQQMLAAGKVYAQAKKLAAQETGLPISTFPEMNPFTAEEILDDDFFANQVHEGLEV